MRWVTQQRQRGDERRREFRVGSTNENLRLLPRIDTHMASLYGHTRTFQGQLGDFGAIFAHYSPHLTASWGTAS